MITNNTKLKTTTDNLETSQLSNIGHQSFKSDLIKVSDDLFNCPLTLCDGKQINIPMRDDGYINVTLLCKASGKHIKEWKKNKSSIQLLNSFFSLGVLINKMIYLLKFNLLLNELFFN